VIAYTVPGLRFFHQGQLEGRKMHISPHLVRAPEEAQDQELEEFYGRLLAVLRKPVMRCGEWQWLAGRPAWDGDGSWDSFVAHFWRGPGGERLLIAVNFAPHPSQCYLNLPFDEIKNRSVRLQDALGPACYARDGNELRERGLYLDLQPWSYHVFELEISE
jgi:hypothetical protein